MEEALKNMNDKQLRKYVERNSVCNICTRQCSKVFYNLDVCVKNVRAYLEKVRE